MTTDNAMEALEQRPAEMEHRLTAAMRGVAHRIAERPEIVRALAAADSLPTGLVVTDEAKAAEVADLVAQVIDGEKLLASEMRAALRIPRAMEEAVRGALGEFARRLAFAKATGNGSRIAYQQELRRRAAQEEQDRRAQAEAAAAAAALDAAATGEDAPPVAEVAPIEVPRVVSGGIGRAGTQVRVKAVEIVDYAQVPQEWVALVPAIANAVFNSAVMTKEVQKPGPGESVTWRGVRFYGEESAVNRR